MSVNSKSKVKQNRARAVDILAMTSRRGNDISFDDDASAASSQPREARGGRRRRRGNNEEEEDSNATTTDTTTTQKKTASEINWGDSSPKESKDNNTASSSAAEGKSNNPRPRRGFTEDGNDSDKEGGSQKTSGPSNGWGDSSTEGKSSDSSSSRSGRGGKSKSSSSSSSGDGHGQRKGKNYFDDDNGSDGDDIPTIPDLDEEEEELEPMAVQIANAPKNVDRRTVNLRDLNTEIKHALPEQAKTGADLSLLTATLCPQEVTVEPDHQWRFDSLFTSTCQEIHAEEQAAEEANTERLAGKRKTEKKEPTRVRGGGRKVSEKNEN